MKKEKVKKKGKVKKIILLILLVIIITLITMFLINVLRPTNETETKNDKITAIKTERYFNQEEEIKYEIVVKDYKLQKIKKTLSFKTEDEAKLEYNKYETINKYERRNIGLELKGKKLILDMPEDQFFEDIGYNIEDNTILITDGNKEELVNLEAVRTALRNQGYTIK